jgi:8-oxo-dGTP pyrophosphatase MutT (NUDIX family)
MRRAPKKYDRKPNIRAIKSYGVSVCRYNVAKEQYEILLVKKRCTYAYVEFILGRYNRNSDNAALLMFNHMTNDEKVTILSLDFGQIYFKVFLVNPDSSNADMARISPEDLSRYRSYKRHFEHCFLKDGGVKLRRLIDRSKNIETIWEIPKGRKERDDPQEKELICATREVKEEAGIDVDQYEILMDISPRKLVKTEDGVKWINYIYIGVCYDQDYDPCVRFHHRQQIAEVVDVKWMCLDEVKIVDPDNMLYNFVKICFKLLKKKKKIGKLSKIKAWSNNQ